MLPLLTHNSQRYQLRPIRYSLFQGVSGIALFLAGAAKSASDPTYRTLALSSLRPLLNALHRNGKLVAQEMGIGGVVGLGSVVYVLTRIGQLLGEEALFNAAREAAGCMSADRIAADRVLDIIAGVAGSLLGLLTLYDVTHEQALLDQAVLCARHLLRARTMGQDGYRVWRTINEVPTTGFAHGAAGIIYALLRLYAVTGDAELLEAAKEGLIYEDCAFLPAKGNWSEVVGDDRPPAVMWCHGAPGIGLARIGGLRMLTSPQIERDIEAALRTTERVGVRGYDHLCCGNSGRADLLLTASLRLGRPDLAATARRHMLDMLAMAEERGAFLLNVSLSPGASLASFFHGLSGIGYTLLRMVQPETLPSVLLWE